MKTHRCCHRRRWRLALFALPLLAACADPIERLCRERPPATWPTFDASEVYFDGAIWNPPGVRGTPIAAQEFARWQLLGNGLSRVELGWREELEQRHLHAELHALPGKGEVLAFRLGSAGEAACLSASSADRQAGLRPGECLAVERLLRPTARRQVRAEDTTPRKRWWWGASMRRDRQLRLWIEHDGQALAQPRFASAYRKHDLIPGDTGCEHYAAVERLRFDTLLPAATQARRAATQPAPAVVREPDAPLLWRALATAPPVLRDALPLPASVASADAIEQELP